VTATQTDPSRGGAGRRGTPRLGSPNSGRPGPPSGLPDQTEGRGAVSTTATRSRPSHQQATAAEPEGALRAPTTAAPADGARPRRRAHESAPSATYRDAAWIAYVDRIVAAAPPFTPEQGAALAGLLEPPRPLGKAS
jgi:hypothetical protein